jgi:hypothetical protein
MITIPDNHHRLALHPAASSSTRMAGLEIHHGRPPAPTGRPAGLLLHPPANSVELHHRRPPDLGLVCLDLGSFCFFLLLFVLCVYEYWILSHVSLVSYDQI